jgi:hypothetical protein
MPEDPFFAQAVELEDLVPAVHPELARGEEPSLKRLGSRHWDAFRIDASARQDDHHDTDGSTSGSD